MDNKVLEQIGFKQDGPNWTYTLQDGNDIFYEKGKYPYLCIEDAKMKYLNIDTPEELLAFIKVVDGNVSDDVIFDTLLSGATQIIPTEVDTTHKTAEAYNKGYEDGMQITYDESQASYDEGFQNGFREGYSQGQYESNNNDYRY